MDEIFATDGPEFSLREEAGEGDFPHDCPDGLGVVVFDGKKSSTATVASEEESCGVFGTFTAFLEEVNEFLIGGLGIAEVELDGLAGADRAGDSHDAGRLIDTHDVGDEEIAQLEVGFVFIHRDADMQSLTGEGLIFSGEFGVEFTEGGEGRLSGNFVNDVVVGFGDDVGLTDGTTALRDDVIDAASAAQDEPDAPFTEDLIVEEECIFSRSSGSGSHASQKGNPGEFIGDVLEEGIDGRGEAVAEKEDGPEGGVSSEAGFGEAGGNGTVGSIFPLDGEGLEFGSGEDRGPETESGLKFDFLRVAGDGFARAAEDCLSAGELADFRADGTDSGVVMMRAEDHHEIGNCSSQVPGDLAADLGESVEGLGGG